MLDNFFVVTDYWEPAVVVRQPCLAASSDDGVWTAEIFWFWVANRVRRTAEFQVHE